jgi:hypothetical protein
MKLENKLKDFDTLHFDTLLLNYKRKKTVRMEFCPNMYNKSLNNYCQVYNLDLKQAQKNMQEITRV